MDNRKVLAILELPWLHPLRRKAAIAHACALLHDIEAGRMIAFRPPVPVDSTCFFVHEERVMSRTVKAYRIRRTGRVYVDMYSAPTGRIFAIEDVYPTFEAAQKELLGAVSRAERKAARAEQDAADGVARDLAADGTPLNAKAERVAQWIISQYDKAIHELHGIGFGMTPQCFPCDENHEIFRDPALKAAVFRMISKCPDIVIKDNGQDIIQFERRREAAKHE